MKIKAFFAPSMWKIIIAIILTLISFWLIEIPVIFYVVSCPLEPCFEQLCPPCPSHIINFYKPHNLDGQVYWPYLIGIVLIEAIAGYIISCLINFIYDLINKPTK